MPQAERLDAIQRALLDARKALDALPTTVIVTALLAEATRLDDAFAGYAAAEPTSAGLVGLLNDTLSLTLNVAKVTREARGSASA